MHPSRAARSVRPRSAAAGALCVAVAGGVLGASPATASSFTELGTSSRLILAGAPVATGGSVQASVRADGATTPALRAERVPTVPAAERARAGEGSATGPAQTVVAELPADASAPFETVAVTWDSATAPADVLVEVRVRRGGAWTGWEPLEYVSDEGPAPGEDDDVRDGTAPWWTGPADGVAVRVSSASGKAPQGLSVVTIDDPTVSAAADNTTVGQTSTRPTALATSAVAVTAPVPAAVTASSMAAGAPIAGSPTFPAMPPIVTRREWGADESLGDQCFEPIYGKTAKMVFIHHTVGDNDYTQAESPAIVRSIHAYHTQGQGWCDIGYNFLVDRFGTVYQGRAGGIRLPVRGSHAGDYNVDTVGISLMGDFEQRAPSDAMKNAVVRLVGWRLGTSYQAPKAHTRIEGTRFRRISGHRDAMSTACPGSYAYAWLPTLRDRVGSYLANYSSPVERKADTLGARRTGSVFVGEVQLGDGRRTVFTRGMLVGRRQTGVHWLSGAVLDRYRDVGGATGPLGLPVTKFSAASQDGVRVMSFDHGRMFVLPDGRVKALRGRILLRWRHTGGFSGRLGAPHTSVLRRRYGAKAGFDGGVIRYETAGNRVTVKYR